jgi:hypothetical protein
MDSTQTVTFPYGYGSTPVSPSIVNAGSTLTQGSYGDIYTNLDETKIWNRALLDHELRQQYLFDRIYTNLPYVEGIGFGKVQADAMYLDMSVAEKTATGTAMRAMGQWTADASLAPLPTVSLFISATNNAATGKQLQYNSLTSTGGGSTSSGSYAFRANHGNTNTSSTSDVTSIMSQASTSGSGIPYSFLSTTGNIGFQSTASNEGIIWGGNTAKIYYNSSKGIVLNATNVTIAKASSYVNLVVCYLAGGALGHCTSIVGIDGSCTCVMN